MCKTASSCEYPACYTILNRALHKRSENVKTVQVSGHFGKIRPTESPFIEVLLNTGTCVKAVVPRKMKQYLLKEQVNLYSNLDKVNLYSNLDKNHGHAM